jgi:hypothetical protein
VALLHGLVFTSQGSVLVSSTTYERHRAAQFGTKPAILVKTNPKKVSAALLPPQKPGWTGAGPEGGPHTHGNFSKDRRGD